MNPAKETTIEVTLLKDGHVHERKPRKTGDKINVTASQAAFLAERGLIDPTTVPAPARTGKGKE